MFIRTENVLPLCPRTTFKTPSLSTYDDENYPRDGARVWRHFLTNLLNFSISFLQLLGKFSPFGWKKSRESLKNEVTRV